jgi:hypothetical protein
MLDGVQMVLDAPAGTMVYGGVYPAGDGDVAPFPSFLLEAHRGEVCSGSFDAESPVETRACAIREGAVAIVPVGIRLGNHPRIFLTFLNHSCGGGASPLVQLPKRAEVLLLVPESSRTPARVIRTSNDPGFRSTLLSAAEQFDPWTEEEFAQAVLRHTATHSTARTWKLMGEQAGGA